LPIPVQSWHSIVARARASFVERKSQLHQALRQELAIGRLPPNASVSRRPVTTPSDDRSAIAKAYHWASRIMIVSLVMVLPGIAGYWVDERLGTRVLFMLVGFALGCTAAVYQLIQLTRSEKNRPVDD
jgi:F0F1-type ATP synthase assembly protein I